MFKIFLKYYLVSLCAISTACEFTPSTPQKIAAVPQENNFFSEASLQVLERIAEDQENEEYYFKKAYILYHQDKKILALRNIKNALAKNPTNQASKFLKALIYKSMDSIDASIQTGNELLQQGYEQADFLLLMAELYWKKQNFDKAEVFLKNALLIHPQNSKIQFLEGVLAIAKADTATAISKLTWVIKQQPSNPEGYYQLASLYYQYKKYIKAMAFTNQGIHVQPQYALLYLRKAEILNVQENVDSAEVYYKRAYQMDLNLYQAAYALGKITLEKGNYTIAASYLKNALKHEANLPKIHFLLGTCYEKQGNLLKALEEYEKSPAEELAQPEVKIAILRVQKSFELLELAKKRDTTQTFLY